MFGEDVVEDGEELGVGREGGGCGWELGGATEGDEQCSGRGGKEA